MRYFRPGASNLCLVAILLSGITTVMLIGSLADYQGLSAAEMSAARGGSIMVCEYSQSCDAYNTYSGYCAGKPDDIICTACENGSVTVKYLDQVTSRCTAPQAPGLKYGDTQPADVNCGRIASVARCKGGTCKMSAYKSDKCNQPNRIISQ